MRSCFLFGFIVLASTVRAQDAPAPAQIELLFASKAEAAQILRTEDEFVKRLSPFDRSARLKTDEEVDTARYLQFASEQALEWTEQEQTNWRAAWQRIAAALVDYQFQVPQKVILIKTTGLEEANAAYTRDRAIILPQSKASSRSPDALLAHELFHVLSRHNVALRDKLYALIGFKRCGELELPAEMQSRRLTNPDGPIHDHCIAVKIDGKPQWVIPILTSKSAKYDKQRGGEFFNYMQFDLIAIQSAEPSMPTQPLLIDGKPLLVDPNMAEGFMEQIGKNTGYIIHPDEVLAVNFSFLVTKRKDVPQPELLEKIGDSLKQK